MRIPSGVTDQYIYFVAVDATDFTTRETGLSSFTVYRSRNGGTAAAMTTPTIAETDQSNMPGVYELLLDEDMTLDAGDDTQEICFHITHAGMAPVTRTIEIYRPETTAGETLTVSSGAIALTTADKESMSDTLLTRQMTEAYAADGTAPTTAQMLFMIWSLMAEKSISSTTLTAKKLDGSTSAMTFTLDSASSPTSITRAS